MKTAQFNYRCRNFPALPLRAMLLMWLLIMLSGGRAPLSLADDAKSTSFTSDNVFGDDNRVNPLRRASRASAPADNPSQKDSAGPQLAPAKLPYYQPPDAAPAPPGAFDPAPVPPRGLQALPTRPHELVAGIPSQTANFPKQSQPPGNCDENPSGYPGPLGPQDENQGWHGSQIPTLYQPGHYPRSIGMGEPLVGTSWMNRPFHADFFSGTMIGDDAIDGVIGQESGFFIGGRLGFDYDYYWGIESRLGTAWMSLFDRQNPQNNIGTGNILVWDINLLYYPWGDSRWRPFLLVGTGIQQLDSYGSALPIYSGTLFELPFGGGLKYQYNEWLSWRFDVIDNFAIGTGSLDTMHNVSFSGGLEYHFGGHRRSYWPWNPNPRH